MQNWMGTWGTFYLAFTADVHATIFNLQPEHIQNKQNLTGRSFLPQYKSMPLKASVSVRNNRCEDSGKAQELKLQSSSYRFQQRSCVFFFTAVHHNWDLSFLFHFFCIPGSSCECYVFSTLEFKRLIPLKAFLPNYRLIKHLTFARIGLFNKYRPLGPEPK